jgi:hypothetical protein
LPFQRLVINHDRAQALYTSAHSKRFNSALCKIWAATCDMLAADGSGSRGPPLLRPIKSLCTLIVLQLEIPSDSKLRELDDAEPKNSAPQVILRTFRKARRRREQTLHKIQWKMPTVRPRRTWQPL